MTQNTRLKTVPTILTILIILTMLTIPTLYAQKTVHYKYQRYKNKN